MLKTLMWTYFDPILMTENITHTAFNLLLMLDMEFESLFVITCESVWLVQWSGHTTAEAWSQTQLLILNLRLPGQLNVLTVWWSGVLCVKLVQLSDDSTSYRLPLLMQLQPAPGDTEQTCKIIALFLWFSHFTILLSLKPFIF